VKEGTRASAPSRPPCSSSSSLPLSRPYACARASYCTPKHTCTHTHPR
jgi:hypothetical protein